MSSSTKDSLFVYIGNWQGVLPSTVTRVIVDYKATTIDKSASFVYIGDGQGELPSNVTRVIVDSKVTSVGRLAFNGCSSLASIEVPSSVTAIGDGAFQGCSSLESIDIPSSVTTIGGHAFAGCSLLASIEIPSSVTSIGRTAFQRCLSLTSITIPSSVTTIGKGAFSGCSSLISIKIPSSITIIGASACLRCSSLTSIEIPSSVTTIGDHAFNGCSSLTSVEIPSSVTTIGQVAFQNCSSLTSIKIPTKVTAIGDHAFNGCLSLTSIKIPSSVTTIGQVAFQHCSSLTSMAIPSKVTTIGRVAFNGCSSLASIKIPCSVTTIGEGAFQNCSSLISIEIPSSVTTIGDGAFNGCSSLRSIEIPSSVTAIGRVAFQKCSTLRSIKIPSSVTIIGDFVFSDCSSLTSIEISSSVTTIGRAAFEDCSALTSIEIPSSVTTIGQGAFDGCSSLISIEITSSVTTIGEYAFCDCSSLTSIEIPPSVTTIGGFVFQSCSSLEAAAKYHHTFQPKTVSENVLRSDHKSYAIFVSEKVTHWLKIRFDNLPLHRVCYGANVTKEKILTCCEDYPEKVREVDNANLTALHVLMSNPRVELEMVEAFLEKYPKATKETDINGRNALHHACYNSHTTVDIVNFCLSDIHKSSESSLLSATDISNYTPCAVAIRQKRSQEIQLALFERYPIVQLNSTKEVDQKQLVELTKRYFDELWNAGTNLLNVARRHGWVHFVSVLHNKPGVDKCVRFIKEGPIGTVEYLAYCKDMDGRSAIDNATSVIRCALEKRILFMGRFELVKGPPVHLSDTSVVLQAIDRQAVDEYGVQFDIVLKEQCNPPHATDIDKDGLRKGLSRLGFETGDERFDSYFVQSDVNKDGRISRDEFVGICNTVVNNDRQGRVVLKFMKNKEQFQREVDSRRNHTLDHNYVVHITEYYSTDVDDDFRSALESNRHVHVEDLSAYKYAIVMPFADRNLDTIFRSERPSDIKIRGIAKEIADAIAHLHKNDMIHGDVKLLNAVRVGSRHRLIDLDASVTIGEGSFVGAKFSSGVLPPEMIAELTVDKFKKCMAYFKTNVSPATLEKIKPKAVTGSITTFAVKTFLTVQSKKEQFDENNNLVWRVCPEPVETEDLPLPYKLVDATAAIDIWSFGALLYELHTGETLFAVNRDHDLKDGANMKELCTWNDEKMMSKLGKVSDRSAYSLLKKVLSADPTKRYKTMEELLKDGYFTALNPAETLELLAQSVTEKVIQNATMVMEIKTEKVLDLIEMSTRMTCNAIFEATEVNTPACFIILPEELPGKLVDFETGDEDHWGDRFDYMQQVLDKVSSCITAPRLDFALDSIKREFIEKPMFLYLVDEYTGKPVVTKGGVYPIQIDVRKKEAKKFLAVMAVGMKAVAVGNTALGLIAMFYPGVIPQIPPGLIEKADNFINDSKPGVIEHALDNTSSVGDSNRGNALREFSTFLREKDADSTFSGMKRLCDTSSGNAIWVTEDSAKKIALENGSSTTETDEVKQLKADNQRAVKQLEDEKAEYEMELKQLKAERLETELPKCTAQEVRQLKADSKRREAELAKSTAEEVQELKVGNKSLQIDKKKLVEETLQKQQLEEASKCVCCVLM
jgi:serine/threonine protein kinase